MEVALHIRGHGAVRARGRVCTSDCVFRFARGKPIALAPAGVYWSYDYQAQTPAPRAHAVAPSGTSDDGIPWMTIGFIVAGTSLLVSGAVFLSTRRRPPTAQPA